MFDFHKEETRRSRLRRCIYMAHTFRSTVPRVSADMQAQHQLAGWMGTWIHTSQGIKSFMVLLDADTNHFEALYTLSSRCRFIHH